MDMRITRHTRAQITTSGYRDRWLRYDTTISIEYSDGLVDGYRVQFDDSKQAEGYLQDRHGMAPGDAYRAVAQAPRSLSIPWEHGATSGSIDGISEIKQVLDILNDSIRTDIRQRLAAEVNLSAEQFYALCTGLHRCNESNRLLARRGLRPGIQVLVQPEGFALDSDFDPDLIRASLMALADDPTACYAIVEA